MRRLKLKNKKIICAISGEVDSSVAAALLKETGRFEVIGVFMRLAGGAKFQEGEKRAKKVAQALKIPFLVLDFKKDFKKRIINCFLKKHKEGVTPNPCVACNKEIKFGLLLKEAKKLKAQFISTGHYVRIKKGKRGFSLMKGKDKEKDQSYFLWKLTQNQLKQILFPIGGYTKKEVRSLVKELKLPSFEFSESQEVCFIPKTTNSFLKHHLKTKPGKIIDVRGNILGQHPGLWFYTIGQRKGINCPGGPFYVLDKNLKKNILIVTKNEKDLYKKEVILKGVNWVSGKKPKLPLKIRAKIRYRHQPAPAVITKNPNARTYTLKFNKPQRAVTPGQSAVFYEGQEVLGGGIIC
jgi:tRNA-specific 2-thiouridylase